MSYARKYGSKYGNSKVVVDGIRFDSLREATYYRILKQREARGEISNLRRQVKYEVIPTIWREEEVYLKRKKETRTIRKCVQRSVHYVADFVYTDSDGKEVVVDVKGYRTRDYTLKKKMMLAFNGIKISEV